MKRFIALFIIGLMIGACATRYRSADTGRSYAEVEGFLRGIQQTGTDSAAQRAVLLADDAATAIYYAEGPGAMGPLDAVAAFYNLQFFSQPKNYWSIKSMKMFYLDRMTGSGHQGALIFEGITNDNQKFTEVFVNDANSGLQPGSIGDDGFSIHLKGSNGQVIEFYSDDVGLDAGEMNTFIQGRISSVDSNGNLTVEHGKISTMVGFF